MDISESSSEDECNIYVNAASKLSALNHQIKLKNNDNKNDDDIIFIDSPKPLNNNKTDNLSRNDSSCAEDSSNDSCCYIEDTDVLIQVNHKNQKNDAIICLDDDDYNNDVITQRITRSSTKKKNTVPIRIDSINILDDSLEEELDKSFSEQEENDRCIIIGSPLPVKKCDSDNYEVSVKVLWRSNKMQRFEMLRYETFQKVFRHYANLEEVPENQILITKQDKRITPFDTPASINWSVIDILDGGIVSPEIAKKNKENSALDKSEENVCKIKVQISDKKSLHVKLKPNEKFTALLYTCAEQLKIPASKLKFYFDGELLDVNETPESLDIDDETCIDLKILD